MSPDREAEVAAKIARIDQKLEDYKESELRRFDQLDKEFKEFRDHVNNELDEFRSVLIKWAIGIAASAIIYAITTALAFH